MLMRKGEPFKAFVIITNISLDVNLICTAIYKQLIFLNLFYWEFI